MVPVLLEEAATFDVVFGFNLLAIYSLSITFFIYIATDKINREISAKLYDISTISKYTQQQLAFLRLM